MTDYDNSNSGALFKNEQKSKVNHPEMRGVAEFNCPSCNRTSTWWVSAWTKTIKSGKKAGQRMQSLAFTAQDDQPSERHQAEQQGDIDDDDIPF